MSEAGDPVDEDARRSFEAAWRAGPAPIEDFLPPADHPAHVGTLAELVAIDLELSWKAGVGRPLDAYLARFPRLASAGALDDLRREEERARAAPPRLTPGMTLGRYRLIEVHARGAFGVVWRAEDTELGREVALKWLARSDDPDARARFVAEAKLTARLEHPGIVPVHELGDAGAPFYTMKLVRGQTLTDVIRAFHAERRPDALAWRRLLEELLSAARALAFAHARGLVHRDVKPDNILVGELGETIVLDWGLARSPASGEREGDVVGTPPYMAPEQAEGRTGAHDARTDVYALGAVLFETLAGRRPSADMRLPSDAPRALQAICRRAMAQDPGARYADAGELGQDLERYLADEPVAAHRERVGERLARSIRRHRTRWSVAAALALSLVAGAVLLLVLARDAEHRRVSDARADAARDEALARGEVAAGRPQAAVPLLDGALSRTEGDGALRRQRDSLAALRDRASRLATLDARDEAAWFLAGEERDDGALAEISAALDAAGDPICADFAAVLAPAEVEACRRRAQRLLVLSGTLRAKGALAGAAAAGCNGAVRDLERARALGATAFGDLIQTLCARVANDVTPPPPRTEAPDSATDAYFFGLAHLWLGDLPAVVKVLLGSMMGDPAIGPGAGIDFERPLQTAIARFREAARLAPREFWHHFMLGSALSLDGDHRAAGLVFGQCVAARPDYPRGLEARGLAAIREGIDGQRPDLVAQGEADFERAFALAPDDPWTYWARASKALLLRQPAAAMHDYARALALDPDALPRVASDGDGAVGGFSTAPQVRLAQADSAALLGDHPEDALAWAVYAGASLALGDDGEAARAAGIALGLPEPPALARTVATLVDRRRDRPQRGPDDVDEEK